MTPLIDLLGTTRAQIVALLHEGRTTVAQLASATGLSQVAIRRHLQELVAASLVQGEVAAATRPGRPAVHYTLTVRGERLFPDRSSDLADDVLTYLHDEQGKDQMIAFLRWRQKRQLAHYAGELDNNDDLHARVQRLAELLSEDGFLAEVDTTNDGFTLTQKHCAIKEAAAAHPQLCAFEAALFRELLDAQVTRRQTIAGGSAACVCHVRPQVQATTQHALTTRGAPDGDAG
jgi:predicted ArsR family transcriptional regulator